MKAATSITGVSRWNAQPWHNGSHRWTISVTSNCCQECVSAFGLGGERGNTRTVREENNTCILVNKIPLQNLSYYTFQNFTITSITENKPIQIRTWIGFKGNTSFSLVFLIVGLLRHSTATGADRRSRREIKEGFPARRKDSTRGRGVTLSVSDVRVGVILRKPLITLVRFIQNHKCQSYSQLQ